MKYICGHEIEEKLKERFIGVGGNPSRLAERLCPECEKAQEKAKAKALFSSCSREELLSLWAEGIIDIEREEDQATLSIFYEGERVRVFLDYDENLFSPPTKAEIHRLLEKYCITPPSLTKKEAKAIGAAALADADDGAIHIIQDGSGYWRIRKSWYCVNLEDEERSSYTVKEYPIKYIWDENVPKNLRFA